MNQTKGDVDHTYVDISVFNAPKSDGTDKRKVLQYIEQRQTPILSERASNYYLSITRFSLQTGNSIPIFIAKVDTANNNDEAFRTAYVLTVKYRGFTGTLYTATQPVQWFPENLTVPVPVAPAGGFTSQPNSEYYYCYSLTHWVRVLNFTLRQCYIQLYTQARFDGFPLRTDYVYQFFELMEGNKLSLNSDFELFNEPYLRSDRFLPEDLHCATYMNNSLATIMSSFSVSKVSDTDIIAPYRFNITNNSNSNILITPEDVLDPSGNKITNHYIQNIQEYDCTSLLSPVQAIVFKSSTIPLTYALTSPQKRFDSTMNSTPINSNTDNILTDFIVNSDGCFSYNGNINYTPTAEYRLIDLIDSNGSFNEIDISAFWSDEYNNLNQFYLDAGCNFSMKILFRKKAFSNK